MTSDFPVIDPDIQRDITDAFHGSDLAALVDAFLSAIDAEATAILYREGLGDREGTADAAHRLASAASQFGFPELAEVARAIEKAGAMNGDSGLNAALQRAKQGAAAFRSFDSGQTLAAAVRESQGR